MAGSRFFGHIKWWFFTVPIMAVCVMPVIPSPELFEVPETEVQSVTATLGQARADEATEHANALFKDTFVETGLVRKTLQATATSDIGDAGANDFARTWVKHFWMLVYRATYRLTVMKLWLIGTIAFGAAAFVDGTVRRKIKAAAAGFASPLSFHLFEQWWPYLNRMSINMQRFGRSTFSAQDQGAVTDWFEKQVGELEAYVNEQFEVAEGFRTRSETEMKSRGEIVFSPTVTLPSLDIEVETYSRFSMRLLSIVMKFDRVMDHFDFLVWNGIRDQSDVDEETARFLRKFHPVGVRGYMTHLRLMTTVRGR